MTRDQLAVGTVEFALAFLGCIVIAWIAFIEFVAPWLDSSDEWSQV